MLSWPKSDRWPDMLLLLLSPSAVPPAGSRSRSLSAQSPWGCQPRLNTRAGPEWEGQLAQGHAEVPTLVTTPASSSCVSIKVLYGGVQSIQVDTRHWSALCEGVCVSVCSAVNSAPAES